jgi:RNA recognition motif-containing protein
MEGYQGFSAEKVAVKSLFVGDLSFFCSEDDLLQLFRRFGNVKAVEIKRGKFGDSLMHGFVEMESNEAAELAIATLNDFKFMGRRMR